MSVSNLTNTKWVFNSNPNFDIAEGGHIDILLNFSSNGNTYTHLIVDDDNRDLTDAYDGIGYSNESPAGGNIPPVYRGTATNPSLNNAWVNQAYRIIEIIDGIDVTNSNLIQWLEANATQVPVVDLSNTKWVFGNTIDVSTDFDYHLNFLDKANIEYYELQVSNDAVLGGKSLLCIEDDDGEDVTNTAFNSINGWQDNIYKTIEFISGTDIANPDLIAWLTENATLQPNVSVKTFDLSTLQLSAGTHTVQVRARAQGYRDSNFSNSVSYTKPATYDVEFVLMSDTNGDAMSHFEYDNKKYGLYDDGFYIANEKVQVQHGGVEIGGVTIGPDYYVKGTLHVPQNQTTTITIYVDNQDASDEFGGDVTISPHGSWNRNDRTLTITGNGWFYIYAVD